MVLGRSYPAPSSVKLMSFYLIGDSNVYTIGYIGSVKVISVKLPMVGWELQAKISSGSITTRLLGKS